VKDFNQIAIELSRLTLVLAFLYAAHARGASFVVAKGHILEFGVEELF
jgi:hypothetical protein